MFLTILLIESRVNYFYIILVNIIKFLFFLKMILIKIHYKTFYNKFETIVKGFKK